MTVQGERTAEQKIARAPVEFTLGGVALKVRPRGFAEAQEMRGDMFECFEKAHIEPAALFRMFNQTAAIQQKIEANAVTKEPGWEEANEALEEQTQAIIAKTLGYSGLFRFTAAAFRFICKYAGIAGQQLEQIEAADPSPADIMIAFAQIMGMENPQKPPTPGGLTDTGSGAMSISDSGKNAPEANHGSTSS